MSWEKYSKILKELFDAEQLSKEKLKEFPKASEGSINGTGSYTMEELREIVLAEIREEAEQIRREAYEVGYAEGKEEGRRIYDEEVEKIRALYGELSKEIENKVREFIDSLTPEIIDFSLKIARKVVSTYVEVDKELVSRLVREALSEVIGVVENIKVEVNPDDLDVVRKCLEKVKSEFSYLKIELEPNPQVSKGGCIVETPTRFIDNEIEVRFGLLEEEIKRKLLDERDGA